MKNAFLNMGKKIKRIFLIALAECRKIVLGSSFWAITIMLCLVSAVVVVYEGVTSDKRAEMEATVVQQEWIDVLTAQKLTNEKLLDGFSMSDVYREGLLVSIATAEKQIAVLEFLKANDTVLYKDLASDETAETYYVSGIAYGISDIKLATAIEGSDELCQISILEDPAASVSVFEANLVFYFVAVLLVVLCFSDEYSVGTIKMVASKPVIKAHVATAKLLAITTMTTVAWAASLLVYLLFAALFGSPVEGIAFSDGAVNVISNIGYNIYIYLDILLVCYGFIAISMFFAVRYKNNVIAVILPFILYFFRVPVFQMMRNLSRFDLFETLKLFEHFVLGNTVYGAREVGQSILFSIGTMLLLLILAIRRFNRFDFDKLK